MSYEQLKDEALAWHINQFPEDVEAAAEAVRRFLDDHLRDGPEPGQY